MNDFFTIGLCLLGVPASIGLLNLARWVWKNPKQFRRVFIQNVVPTAAAIGGLAGFTFIMLGAFWGSDNNRCHKELDYQTCMNQKGW